MTKIALATHVSFWRCSRGSEQRITSLHKALVDAGFEVKVFFIGDPRPSDRERISALDIDLVPSTFTIKRSEQLRQVVKERLRDLWAFGLQRLKLSKAREAGFGKFESLPTRVKFNAFIDQFAPDVVLVEYLRLDYLVKSLRGPARPMLVIDTHDVMSRRLEDYAKAGIVSGYRVSVQEEARLLKKYDLVVAIQHEDAAAFAKMLPGKQVVTALHGLSGATAARTAQSDSETLTLGFVGTNNEISQRSLRHFLAVVWPSIFAKYGAKVQLCVAGRIQESFMSSSDQKAGVRWLGFVDDLGAFYDSLDLFVHPLLCGSGLKIKIVEALVHGVPVVTTEAGAQGMAPGEERGLLVASPDQEMIAVLDNLLSNAKMRGQLARAAAAYGQAKFGLGNAYGELTKSLAGLSNRTSSVEGRRSDDRQSINGDM